ncbi:MAG: energy-coupling factor transporter ATPase [Halanaerobiaceae bacterium]
MLISIKDLTHIYEQDPPVKALDKINLDISRGEFIGLIGSTGSGKSTLVQMFNGLIKPTHGQVLINDEDITKNKKKLKGIRQNVGLVFQYPEHQLFEETIYKEIAFGPQNLDLKKDEIRVRVQEALQLVDMDFDSFKDRSPFNLSGGQQRKIALAGVLAMKPDVLILDEPFAGLDPEGRKQLTALLKKLHQEKEMTLILISHRMEEIAYLTTRILVLKDGSIKLEGTPQEVFSKPEILKKMSLDIPQITEVLYRLQKKGLKVRTSFFNVSEAADEIVDKLRSS